MARRHWADIRKKIPVKKKYLVLCLVVIVVVLIGFIFTYFIPLGYRMTVSAHGFNEILHNVYLNSDCELDKEETVKMINEARARVAGYFGEVKSDPVIIICDNKARLTRLGGDHDTKTAVFISVNSYVAISPEYLNIDVLSQINIFVE